MSRCAGENKKQVQLVWLVGWFVIGEVGTAACGANGLLSGCIDAAGTAAGDVRAFPPMLTLMLTRHRQNVADQTL